MPTIKFQTNQPVEVRLRSIEGRPVESQFGGVQHMFSAEEGAFYVSETVGQILTDQLRKLRVTAGEPVEICKGEVNRGNGRKGIQWVVTQVGEPPSELEEKLAQSLAQVEARKAAAQISNQDQPKWAQSLSMQTKHVLDVYAELVAYSSAKHGNLVRPDDVRTMMTTVFINLSKQGGSNSNAA